jgi:hypothetical protein
MYVCLQLPRRVEEIIIFYEKNRKEKLLILRRDFEISTRNKQQIRRDYNRRFPSFDTFVIRSNDP